MRERRLSLRCFETSPVVGPRLWSRQAAVCSHSYIFVISWTSCVLLAYGYRVLIIVGHISSNMEPHKRLIKRSALQHNDLYHQEKRPKLAKLCEVCDRIDFWQYFRSVRTVRDFTERPLHLAHVLDCAICPFCAHVRTLIRNSDLSVYNDSHTWGSKSCQVPGSELLRTFGVIKPTRLVIFVKPRKGKERWAKQSE